MAMAAGGALPIISAIRAKADDLLHTENLQFSRTTRAWIHRSEVVFPSGLCIDMGCMAKKSQQAQPLNLSRM